MVIPTHHELALEVTLTARILSWPASDAQASIPPRIGAWSRRYRFVDVVARLALDCFTPRVQIEHLRILVAKDGMPAPINPRIYGGKVLRGAAAVGTRSEWDRAQIEAWLHQPGPDAPVVAALEIAPPAPQSLRDEMAARAIRMVGGRA